MDTPQPSRPRRKRSLWWILGTLLLLIGIGTATCVYFRISSINDGVAYVGMMHECPPIWKDLALRRIGLGDSQESLERRHPPTERENVGPFMVLTFDPPFQGLRFTSLRVVVRKGILVEASAASCTWRHSFFGEEQTREEIRDARLSRSPAPPEK